MLRRRCARLVPALLLVVAGVGCGGDEATEYGDANREAFLAACTDSENDELYQQRICLCVYQEAEATIPFERFVEVSDQLADAESPGLPDDILDVLANCIIEEGDL